MSTVIASCKDEAAEVFDMALDHNPGGDLGAIIRGMRHHYCGSLTFREQRNAVENMCQGASEDAADFLVRVNSAVCSLGKDWQDAISPEELETLRFEVAMNGVKLDVRHVLDSEAAKYKQLSSKQIYDAVKRYEVYAARNKCLVDKGPYVGFPKGSCKAPAGTGYRPHYPKVTAFSAQATEKGGPPSKDAELKAAAKEGLVELSPTPTNEELGGDCTPDFQALMELAEIHPSVSARMAQAIQADERLKKHCFACQSPDHFIRECLLAKKMERGPSHQGGLPKTIWLQLVEGQRCPLPQCSSLHHQHRNRCERLGWS